MKINIQSLTSAIKKIQDLASEDKTKPGILLHIVKDEDVSADEENPNNGKVSICYSDGHKSFIEVLDCIVDDADKQGEGKENAVAVDYALFTRAINNIQPAGNIKVRDVELRFIENNIIRVIAEQYISIEDKDGNVTSDRELAVKKIDVQWSDPNASMKTAILTRMDYDSIFVPDATPDEFDRDELLDALQKTSTEKDKQLYISKNFHSAFVCNQAHVTYVPISRYDDLSQEEKDTIRGEMVEAGTFTEEGYANEIMNRETRIHNSVVFTRQIAKALVSILGKCNCEKVSVHRKGDKFCNVVIESDTEKVGVWFEMGKGSKAHIGTVERYTSYKYDAYQVTFLREVLVNSVKSAMDSNKNDRTVITFEDTELDTAICGLDFVINASNAGASIIENYRVNPEEVNDAIGDIKDKKFTISLKVFNDMLAQLKTEYVAVDFNVDASGSACIRVAEIDAEKQKKEYLNARLRTQEQCKANGETYDEYNTPTPLEFKMDFRANVLNTRQYTLLAK